MRASRFQVKQIVKRTGLLFLTATFILVLQVLNARAGTLWTKTYGGAMLDRCEDVFETSDGGLFMVGRTESFGAGDWDVYLIRTDSGGDTLWTKTYGGSGNDWAHLINPTTDGGFIISATTRSLGRADSDNWLIRTDANGDTLWTKVIGGDLDDWGQDAEQTPDGGFIMGSTTRSFGAGDVDWWLIRTDSMGATLWTKTYGGLGNDGDGAVVATIDGSFVSAVKTSSFGVGGLDVWLIKTDADGDSLWSRMYGGSGIDKPSSLEQTSDGGFIIAGETDSFGTGDLDVYLIRTDAEGNVMWERTFGGPLDDGGESARETADGGFIVTGYTKSFGAGGIDFYVFKIDASGYITWEDTFGGTATDWGTSGIQTNDGNYVITGRTQSFGAGDYDVYLVKMSQLVGLRLYSPSSPVPYDGIFAINGLLTNTSDEEVTLETQVLVTPPCQNVFEIGPPVQHILEPHECKVIYTVESVPSDIPLGVYLYTLEVSENDELVASASEEFEVVEGCPGEGIMLQVGELPANLYMLRHYLK